MWKTRQLSMSTVRNPARSMTSRRSQSLSRLVSPQRLISSNADLGGRVDIIVRKHLICASTEAPSKVQDKIGFGTKQSDRRQTGRALKASPVTEMQYWDFWGAKFRSRKYNGHVISAMERLTQVSVCRSRGHRNRAIRMINSIGSRSKIDNDAMVIAQVAVADC